MELTQHQADAFARMPLTYLRQEYPNHIMHLLNDDGDVLPPRELHPIFYGCFDWHSAVHGYWLLLRCVRLYPELPCRDAIVALFDEHITEEKVAKELAYFTAPFRASFERPYGYGWLLALAQELKQSSLPQAAGWYQMLEPLTQDIRNRLVDYLGKLTYPIRVGTHYSTAFALALALVGCALVTGVFTGGLSLTTKGMLFGLGAAFFYALYSIFAPFGLRHYSPLAVVFWTFVFAALGALFVADWGNLMTVLSVPQNALLAAGLVLLSTVAPYILYTKGLANVESGKASIMASIEPVVGTLVGTLVFGEPISAGVFLGLACILACVYILR